MNTFSLTQAGNWVAFISFILGVFKINIATEEVSQFVTAALTLAGLVMSFYGRYRKGDLTLAGVRK